MNRQTFHRFTIAILIGLVQTIKWVDGVLRIIDQTKLPTELVSVHRKEDLALLGSIPSAS